jgi:predicted O-methyltransferase YrrM
VKDPGLTIVEMLDWLYAKKQAPLRIVECGTIRNPTFEGHEDGLATYHVAKWIRDNWSPDPTGSHEFYSFELTAGHIAACREFLGVNALSSFVTFGLGDADLLLEHFCQPIDVCYLDAGADPVANLSQYRRAEKWLRAPGMVVIDDVFDPRNADRGLVTVPYARLEGRKVACIDGRLALISFGVDDYPLPPNSYWLEAAS